MFVSLEVLSATSLGDKLQILEEQALGMLHRRAFLHLSALAVAQLAFQRVVRHKTISTGRSHSLCLSRPGIQPT